LRNSPHVFALVAPPAFRYALTVGGLEIAIFSDIKFEDKINI
jgi:hypothetical protein